MVHCTARKGPSLRLSEVIANILPFIKGPIISNIDFGHIKHKLTIPNGVLTEVSTSPLRITILENVIEEEGER